MSFQLHRWIQVDHLHPTPSHPKEESTRGKDTGHASLGWLWSTSELTRSPKSPSEGETPAPERSGGRRAGRHSLLRIPRCSDRAEDPSPASTLLAGCSDPSSPQNQQCRALPPLSSTCRGHIICLLSISSLECKLLEDRAFAPEPRAVPS